jgi:general secretion pathway protein I
MSAPELKLPRGFTLVEVLVALVIVAFGMGAVLAALSSAADTTARLRDKSLAEWIGFNQISTVRLALTAPADGKSTGQLDYAGARWYWQQEVEELQVPGIKRISVQVKRLPDSSTGVATATSDDGDWLATTLGFRGDAINAANGELPDWDGPAIGTAPGPGGTQASSTSAGGAAAGGSSTGESPGTGNNNGVTDKP